MDRGKPEPKRVYQVWKGNNKFFFGGRLIFGPDVSSLLLSILLIVAPAIAFSVKSFFIIRNRLREDKNVAPWYPVLLVAVALTMLDLFFLFIMSTRDPGIVPRNRKPPESDEAVDINTPAMEWFDDITLQMRLPRTKDVLMNGHIITVKFCYTCLLYRPPRCSHCSVCNNCVQRFDHHCPWVGQCIGIRNYRFYYMFIFTTTVLCMHVFVFSWYNIVSRRGKLWEAILSDYTSDALIVYCFFAFWFVGGLSVYHFYLICKNKTTYEDFRSQYIKLENPYNKGMIKNFKEVFFSAIPPSKIDFRAIVEEDEATEMAYTSSKEVVSIEIRATLDENNCSNHLDNLNDTSQRPDAEGFAIPVERDFEKFACILTTELEANTVDKCDGISTQSLTTKSEANAEEICGDMPEYSLTNEVKVNVDEKCDDMPMVNLTVEIKAREELTDQN